MEKITKPSITRLARKAGVKSISEDCFSPIRILIDNYLNKILSTACIVNSGHNTKTLMTDDIYNAMYLLGNNITQSNNLGSNTNTK